jgi:hypothetical protein
MNPDRNLADLVLNCESVTTVEPLKVGQSVQQNELLLFIKPEIFTVEKRGHIDHTIALIFDKLQKFDAHARGVVIINGRVLDELEIMNRHYGFINQLSRSASKMLDDADRDTIAAALNISSLDNYAILGGHEYLGQYPDQDAFELDKLWFTKKSVKLRSGFYVQSYVQDGQDIILVNGFHPVQLAHYTDPSHRIVLMLIHSNTDWMTLRNEMIGATFPERAVPESIRGTLYGTPEKFGLQSVSIANNGVHLSAGPFEALFEIVNFGRAFGLDSDKQVPLIVQKMLDAGMHIEQALDTLNNPIAISLPKAVDLYTATEDMNTAQAVTFWKENGAPT